MVTTRRSKRAAAPADDETVGLMQNGGDISSNNKRNRTSHSDIVHRNGCSFRRSVGIGIIKTEPRIKSEPGIGESASGVGLGAQAKQAQHPAQYNQHQSNKNT